MKKALVCAVMLALTACELVCAQSVPPLVNYQGMLTDANGQGLQGTKKLEFNIYDAATGGSNVWGPQVFSSVPVINGQFNVILGTTDTGGRSIANAFGESQRFLGIKVDDGPEIAPRQQILSAPFAVHSDTTRMAETATDHSNIIPVGTIVAFAGSVAPKGWRFCDGSNGTPDLRGVFLRGLDNGRNIDPGRTILTFQEDDFESHIHHYDDAYFCEIHGGNHQMLGSHSTDQDNGPLYMEHPTYATGGSETRPKNVAVNYIIKVNYE